VTKYRLVDLQAAGKIVQLQKATIMTAAMSILPLTPDQHHSSDEAAEVNGTAKH